MAARETGSPLFISQRLDAPRQRNRRCAQRVVRTVTLQEETEMSFGKGALMWLIGIPIPIILLIALFWR
jgi:hypothetical protein